MNLCSLCDKFDLKDLLDWDDDIVDVPHHASLAALEESAVSCQLCRLFFKYVTAELKRQELEDGVWEHSPLAIRGLRVHDKDHNPRGFFMLKVRSDRAGYPAWAYFSLYPDEASDYEGSAVREFAVGRPIRPSDQFSDVTKPWISECDAKHQCWSPQPPVLPSRVLDVGEAGGNEPRLKLSSGERGYYITLSHCWGLNPLIRTLKANVLDHIREIPLTSLPKTFRDAIEITRELGIRYLWIDSLCIIQDSLEDWEAESVKMGDIYASSFLTIAASASSDSSGGCLIPRTRDDHVKIKCTLGSAKNGSVWLRPRMRTFSNLGNSPLHVRAWVTQERLLSRRTVHFDADQLLWECREARWAEEGLAEDVWDQLPNAFAWKGRFRDAYPYDRPGVNDPGELAWDWYGMVEAYSARGITKGQDKLPAVSGLAKLMEERSGEQYVAGLWQGHLVFGILWRRRRDWLKKPASGYRAPSWSWAAWDGEVSMPSESEILPTGSESRPAVKNITAETKPLHNDPRGMLASGFLKLTGKLKRVDRRLDRSAGAYMPHPQDGWDYLLDSGERVGMARFDFDYAAPAQLSVPPLFCLKVAERAARTQRWYGLLLEPTGNVNEYQRVGYARTDVIPSEDWFSNVPMVEITMV